MMGWGRFRVRKWSEPYPGALRANRPPVHTLHVPYRENPVRALRAVVEGLDELDARLSALPAQSLAGRDQLAWVVMVMPGMDRTCPRTISRSSDLTVAMPGTSRGDPPRSRLVSNSAPLQCPMMAAEASGSHPCCMVPAAPRSLTTDTCWLTSVRIAVPTVACVVFESTGTIARGVTEISWLDPTPIESATTPGI